MRRSLVGLFSSVAALAVIAVPTAAYAGAGFSTLRDPGTTTKKVEDASGEAHFYSGLGENQEEAKAIAEERMLAEMRLIAKRYETCWRRDDTDFLGNQDHLLYQHMIFLRCQVRSGIAREASE